MKNAILEETSAKLLIERFAEKQQGGHFACPRCGRMTMDTEGVTRNALSRRAAVYVCDACGMQEALEDMMDSRTPLTEWAIAQDAEAWRMKMLEVLELYYLGYDRLDSPVYKRDGKFYVDVEPCDAFPEGTVIEFVTE